MYMPQKTPASIPSLPARSANPYDCGGVAYSPSNREKSMQASKQKWWCPKCDGAHVGSVGICTRCGFKCGTGKIKMPPAN